jgi:hypothetical protein
MTRLNFQFIKKEAAEGRHAFYAKAGGNKLEGIATSLEAVRSMLGKATTIKPIILLCGFLTWVYGCKKDTAENQLPVESVCLLDTVYKEDGMEVRFYNSSNKLVKVIWSGNTWSYIQHISYQEKLITFTVEGEPGSQRIWLNGHGYADSMFSDIGVRGTTAYRFYYNEKQQLVEQHSHGFFDTFEWDNLSFFEYAKGNLIRKYILRDIDTFYTDYNYDLTKENTLQSYDQPLQYLPANKNLLTGITHSDGTEMTFTFIFDAKGKVIKRTTEHADATFSEEQFSWVCR